MEPLPLAETDQDADLVGHFQKDLPNILTLDRLHGPRLMTQRIPRIGYLQPVGE